MKKTAVLILILMLALTSAHADNLSLDKVDNQPEEEEYFVYDIFKHEEMASNILLGWGGLSLGSGVIMNVNGNEFARGLGIQNVIWGGIDTALAIWLKSHTDFAGKSNMDPVKEQEWFRDILAFNFFLDIAYIAAGAALMIASEDDNIKGHGAGVLCQGFFLFCFDGINYKMSETLEREYKEREVAE